MKWRQARGIVMLFAVALGLVSVFLTGGADAQAAQPGQGEDANAAMFGAEQVMTVLNDGLTGHNSERFLSAFDPDQMQNYSSFADQVRTFFGLYDNFRVHYQILEVHRASNAAATVTANLELEADDAHNDVPGLSRNGQIHLHLSTGKRGWKISDLQPREFFR